MINWTAGDEPGTTNARIDQRQVCQHVNQLLNKHFNFLYNNSSVDSATAMINQNLASHSLKSNN